MQKPGRDAREKQPVIGKAQTMDFISVVCAFFVTRFMTFKTVNSALRRKGALLAAVSLLVPLSVLLSVLNTNIPAQAATSNQLNFQGRLLTSSGDLVPDGIYNMQFDLYSVSSGGSTLWTEDRLVSNTQGVSIQNGYYSVYLGEYDSLPSIDWSQDLYLGMTVRGTTSCVWGSCSPADSEMTPRFKLTAVPYAMKASNVASSSTNAASTNSDNVSITTGNALGATSNSGNITLDVGSATGTAGTISLGSANASALIFGNSTSNPDFTFQGTGTFTIDSLDCTGNVNGGALTANGSGVISCSDDDGGGGGSGVTTVGALDGGVANANGATITGSTIYLQSADVTYAGLVNVSAQTFNGVKTFDDGAIVTTGGLTISAGALAVNSDSITSDGVTLTIDAAGTVAITDNLTVTGTIVDTDSNLILADTVDIGSATTGVNVTTAGVLSDIDGDLILADQLNLGSATTGLLVTTAGLISDLDGNVVINDAIDLGSATTGINITTAGVISDIDGAVLITDNLDVNLNAGANTTNIATGTTTGLVTIGGGFGTFALDTTNIDISNAGVISGATGLSTTGTVAISGAGNFSLDSSAFDVTTGGAVSGVTTLTLSGAISGGTSVTGSGNFNTTAGVFQLNGTDINTAGTLTNVAYENQANTFTQANILQGNVDFTGSQFTNSASTLNSAQAIADDVNGGNIGASAAVTVDVDTAFILTQTTAGQTMTLFTPTSASAGRLVYVTNSPSSTTSFSLYGVTLAAGATQSYVWNGSAWTAGSVDGSGSGVSAMAVIGAVPNANGASIASNTLTLQPADASFGGVVTTGAQTIAGAKTFNGAGSFTAAGTGLAVTNNATIGGTLTVTGTSTFNGALVIGDAVGDTVTVNSGAWTFANDTTVALNGGVNGLNIDSDTLSVDATNNKLGIGNAAPTYRLDISQAGQNATDGVRLSQGSNEITLYNSFGNTGYLDFNVANSYLRNVSTNGYLSISTPRDLTLSTTQTNLGSIILNAGSTGNSVKLQTNSTDRLTIDTAGAASFTGTLAATGNTTLTSDLTVNGNTTLGNAVTDNITVAGAIQGASALIFDGATDNTNEITLAITDPGADFTITLPAETGTVCTTGSVCSGYVASTVGFIQNGNSFTANAVLGTNDSFSLILETANVAALTINTSQNVTLAGDLAVNGGDITSTGD
ncbi:MAG: hypothetical protein Q7T74_05655, partial [Candidatus Saccharibacteria bacterium]|nr:hypothetical protein [Candidatus Saccharibacteria bacterium]